MQIKKLAYLKINILNPCDEFCEIYTFTKPTILYLPHNLILCIKTIELDKICFIVTSKCDPTLNKKIVLSLCGPRTKKIVVSKGCKKITLCFKLCEINILKPRHQDCSHSCHKEDDDYPLSDLCFHEHEHCHSECDQCHKEESEHCHKCNDDFCD